MTILRDTKRRQRSWATSRGIAVDQNGYVPDWSFNLYESLSPAFLSALENAGGSELEPQRNRPAKICALHSSAVLAINVFQYWEDWAGAMLPAMFGHKGELAGVAIEQQFSTGLKGTPPTLDVVLTLVDESIVAVESKFTEWMTKKRVKLDYFKAKYLSVDPGHWVAAGLPRCQQLAEQIASGEQEFRYLDALQLLKHALGLQKNRAGKFSLVYLYYDYEGESDIAATHREEAGRFGALVDEVLGFSSRSYQQLFGLMSAEPGVDRGYLDYLGERYFSDLC